MKKLFITILMFVSVFVPLAANNLFSFQGITQVPLFKEPAADPYAFNSHLNVLIALDENQRPNKVYSIITEKK